jgi:Na+/H+-dicarboxylate symporter
MALGAGTGLLCNFRLGDYALPKPVDFFDALAPGQFGGTFWSHDRPGRIAIQVVEPSGDRPRARRFFVGVPDQSMADRPQGRQLDAVAAWPLVPAGSEIVETIEPTLDELRGEAPRAYALFQQHGRSTARAVADRLKLVGDLFLRLLRMVSVPLIIFSLTTGVVGLGGAERLGKMFARLVAYYFTTLTLAVTVGLAMVRLLRPGAGGSGLAVAKNVPAGEAKQLSTVLFEQLEKLIPPNPIQAVAEGEFLGIIIYTLAFAVFAVLAGGKTAQTVRDFAAAGFDVMMRMTTAIIRLAPLGVFALIFFAAATQGVAVFGKLGMYMLTVACGLAIHGLVVLPLIVKFVARRSPWQFAKDMSPALLTAFSSASGNATLPVTLASAEQRAGIDNRISSFALPLGATMNMDGTALYEVVAVLFIANMTPGVDLTLVDQAIVAFTALLVSIGGAGIPHAGLVMMIVILQAVGLPVESQCLIIAVDRVLDMCRTCVNVWSDSCGCAVVARFESAAAG